MLQRPLVPLLFLVVSAAPAVAAQQNGSLKLDVKAFQEIEEVTDGQKTIKTIPIAKAVPGTEVIYVITYTNVGAEPASRVVVTNPVPEQLSYKDNSAFGAGTTIEVSADGGKSWGELGALTVAGADGSPRPAQAEDVTHVRWKLGFAVKPGEQGKVSYRATIK